ncbi:MULTISPECIES: phage receptor [Pseudomonas]|uniref:phage receptor n=1 Tax=Pseudomonas TaxID=286 RepID=UPI0013E05BD4|nr:MULTISPECIES: phage receptor [Pseudomonas]MCE0910509.1 phage receptor [Pseudomonas kurunegalensis]QIG18847.1 phage receptor [Pseudomonas monteilii]QIG24102.1 phage receptor [Pseudomonas monteilii]WJR53515.1 phage receptor [Pseudomonas kurunegalensis]
MKPRFTLTFTGLLLCSAALPVAASAPMTDFQRFTSFPFMDRSYREARKDNWAEVERLTRHVLGRVPNNDEARALLVEALAHQRRYKDAEALAEQLQGSPEYADALLELRLTWIEQDPPPASQVEQWLATSDAMHRVRLWQAYSLSLAKFGGAGKALEWLNQLPPRDDGQVLRLARASFAEQLRNWKETIEQLQPLADKGQLPAGDWQRLANAYIQQVDEKGLNTLLASAPSPQAASQARLAMANRAIAVGHNQQAQRWLQSLPPDQLNQPEQRQQLWELAREGDDAAMVMRLSNALQRPCLETVDWLSRHDPDLAREQFKGCTTTADARAYAVLKQRLYGDPPQPPQPLTASEWEKRYRQSDDLAALEQATFLLVEQGQVAHARELLEHAYDRRQGRLSPSLLQRLGNLYTRTDGPLDSRRMLGLIPRVDANTRAQLLSRLAEAGQCDAVHQAIPATPSEPGQYRALGRCAMPDQPGEAVVYYQAAERLGGSGDRLPLAYALEAAGDSEAALPIWRSVPDSAWTDNARLTAARGALNAGDAEAARRYWDAAAHHSADDWALGAAIAQRQGDYPSALGFQRQALASNPRADHYYAAASTAQLAGDSAQSMAWLAEAVRLAPDQPRYRADYGMRLAGATDKAQRRQSIPYLEQATHDFPEDYRLGETLALRYDEAEDSASARRELRRILDVEQNLVDGDDEYGSLEARKYRQRRAHEALSRRDTITLASTWSPAGTSTNDKFLDNGQRSGSSRRAQSQNVQLVMWDHALGEEPSRNGSTLSVYGRVLFGGQGRTDYAQSMGTGVGLRYKPLGQANLNLYAELYHQRQIDEEHYRSMSLGQLLSPAKVGGNWGDLRHNAESSNDLLLRATASFLDQGDWRNDWRVDEDDWNERFLYLDAAWWTRAGDHAWLSRYQQGHAWKLPSSSPQTLMPYGFVEFSSQDPSNDWRQDARAGVGVRWQWWFDDDRYNAYRGSLKVRAEYQQSLGGNLYERANGVLVGAEMTF